MLAFRGRSRGCLPQNGGRLLWAQRALTENGTYQGCSFEFYPKDYQVTEREAADGKKEYVIRHTAFERITALTLAMNPAYPTTSVGVRELYEKNHQETDEEREAREKAEREAKELEELEQQEREAMARRAYEHRKRNIEIENFY